MIKDFTLPNVDKEKINLMNLLDKQNVLLLFYRGSWWSAWEQRLSRVRQDYDQIKKTNTEVVTISGDTPEETKEFKNKLNLPFIMLSDENLDVIREYNTLDEKEREAGYISLVATFIISKEKVQYEYISQDHWEDVPSNQSIIEILEKMEDES